jgi:hypothetical protein
MRAAPNRAAVFCREGGEASTKPGAGRERGAPNLGGSAYDGAGRPFQVATVPRGQLRCRPRSPFLRPRRWSGVEATVLTLWSRSGSRDELRHGSACKAWLRTVTKMSVQEADFALPSSLLPLSLQGFFSWEGSTPSPLRQHYRGAAFVSAHVQALECRQRCDGPSGFSTAWRSQSLRHPTLKSGQPNMQRQRCRLESLPHCTRTAAIRCTATRIRYAPGGRAPEQRGGRPRSIPRRRGKKIDKSGSTLRSRPAGLVLPAGRSVSFDYSIGDRYAAGGPIGELDRQRHWIRGDR